MPNSNIHPDVDHIFISSRSKHSILLPRHKSFPVSKWLISLLQTFIASHPQGDWLKWQDGVLILCCVPTLVYISGVFHTLSSLL